MSKNEESKSVAVALGATFAVTLAVSPLVNAAENPFGATQFASGHMVAGEEGKCGSEKGTEGKCGNKGETKGTTKEDMEGKYGSEQDAEGKHDSEQDAEGKHDG